MTKPRGDMPLFQACSVCGVVHPFTAFQWTRAGRYTLKCYDCAFPLTVKTEHTCVRCGQTKPVSEFSLNRGRTPKSWCKACGRVYMDAWHAAHPVAPKPPKPKPTEKQCPRCKRVFPIEAFTFLVGYNRHVPYCRDCTRERSRESYRDHYDRWLDYGARGRARRRDKMAQWRRKNRHLLRDNDARRRAREKNAPRVEKIDQAAIIARDEGTCYLCGRKPVGDDLTLDHVVPLVRGGSHTADNLRVCCRSCNSSKRTRLLEELAAIGWLPRFGM